MIPPPLDPPMVVRRILGDQAGVVPIGADASRNAALDRAIKVERFDPCCCVPSDRQCQQHRTMGVAVVRVDGDEVWRWQNRVTVGMVGATMIDIVRHPPERCRPVELNVPMFEGKLFFTDFQSVTEDIRAIRPGRDQAREELPQVGGRVVDWMRIGQHPPFGGYYLIWHCLTSICRDAGDVVGRALARSNLMAIAFVHGELTSRKLIPGQPGA